MKRLSSLFCVTLICALYLIRHSGWSEEVGTISNGIKRLLDSQPENDRIAFQKWGAKVRMVPGITPELFTLLWSSLEREKSDEVGRLLAVLRFRDDIGTTNTKRLVITLEALIKDDLPSRESVNFTFALGVIPVIANNDKSASTERLFLRFLRDADVHSDWRFFDDQVLDALKLIGASDSVRAIDDHVKRRWGGEATKSWEYQKFEETETAIKARLASSSPSEVTSSQQVSPPNVQRTSPHASASAQPSSQNSDSIPWLVSGVMIAAAVGLLWLLLRRRW